MSKKAIYWTIIFIIICIEFLIFIYPNFKDAKTSESLTKQTDDTTTICNDCHPNYQFKPKIIGKKIYFGNWLLQPEYLLAEVETTGTIISIYPDKFRLPDSLDFCILIDASHGTSMEAKYFQVWKTISTSWVKLSKRESDWVLQKEVLYQIK